jgi:purine-binding chemotaxis protein CheW
VSEARGAAGKYLTFKLGQEEYGVDVLRVREVLALPPITPLPGVAAHVEGVMNLRGRLVPVIDLRARLGCERLARTKRSCAIVFDVGGLLAAGIIDAHQDVLDLGPSDISPPPADERGRLVLGLGRAKGRLAIILDIDRVFEGTLAIAAKDGAERR